MSGQKQKPQYLTDVQVSEITGLALSTLRNDRWLRRGIIYVKKGRAVRYALEDVQRFMESKKIRFDE